MRWFFSKSLTVIAAIVMLLAGAAYTVQAHSSATCATLTKPANDSTDASVPPSQVDAVPASRPLETPVLAVQAWGLFEHELPSPAIIDSHPAAVRPPPSTL